jgi:hypothetical protein
MHWSGTLLTNPYWKAHNNNIISKLELFFFNTTRKM